MKYILACFFCFILSSCATIPDKAYHKIRCSDDNACSKAELDGHIEHFNPVTDMVIKNGFSAFQACDVENIDIDKTCDIDIDEEIRKRAKIDKTSFSIFYLEYDEKGKKFEGNRQLDVIKRAIDTSDKPIYLNVYVNSWHNNAYTEEKQNKGDKKTPKLTKEAKYFPYILARRHFQNPDMHVIGVYVGWQGEKYKYSPTKWVTPKSVADIADKIGDEGNVRLDIISMVDHVQMNPHSGHSLVMGKSFGARLLSRAFVDDLIGMKSIEDWPLGKRSLLVNLNPAIGANAFDEVFENMPEKAVNLQRPIWLNMTSKNDTATSWLYPKARFIGQNLSDEPVQNGMNKIYKTIGHYMPYLSYEVTSAGGINGPDPDNNTEEDLIRCNFDDAQAILKDNKPWFEIPLRADEEVACATRHLYENERYGNDDSKRYYTTTLRRLEENPEKTTEKNLGYMWNFRIDKSIIENGSADSRFSKGYHSADVQTILGRMLDDMLFTPPEKPLD